MTTPGGAPPGPQPSPAQPAAPAQAPAQAQALPPPPPPPLAPAGLARWPFPDDHSLVGEAETLVRALAQGIVRDSQLAGQLLLGKDGRPFGAVKLTPRERAMRYAQQRSTDDPNAWLAQLQQGNPRQVVASWKKHEQQFLAQFSPEDAGEDVGSEDTFDDALPE